MMKTEDGSVGFRRISQVSLQNTGKRSLANMYELCFHVNTGVEKGEKGQTSVFVLLKLYVFSEG